MSSAPESNKLTPAERWQALLALLPAAALAWPGPGSILSDVFAATELTAAGAALLLTLPALALLAIRGGAQRPAGLLPLLAVLLFAFVRSSLGTVHDQLEASRAIMTLLVALAMFLCGASLSSGGRTVFMRGAMLISLCLTLWALIDSEQSLLGGIVGNTGELSAAALFGAVCAAHISLHGRASYRVLGGLTVVLFLWQAADAPAIASLASFVVAILASAILIRRSTGERNLLGAFCVLAALAFGAFRAPALEDQSFRQLDEAQAQAQQEEQIFGGFAVRALIWKSTAGLIADNALLGVGPGQFPVEFPLHRDPREIQASTLDRAPGFYMEVEHAHNDWLQAFAEYGVIAGTLFVLFLLLVLRRAALVLRGDDRTLQALGAGSIAVLGSAAANSTLLANPAASTIAFCAFGALLARPRTDGAQSFVRRALPVGVLLMLVFSSKSAMNIVKHGRALAQIQAAGSPSAGTYRRVLDEAIAACPNSVTAHTLLAQLRGELFEPSDKVLREWTIVLDSRPHRVQALMESARRQAILGEYGEARALVEHVLRLDPEHPTALRNTARFELYAGRLQAGEERLQELAERGLFDATFGLSLGSKLLLDGKAREAVRVLAMTDETLADLDGDGAWVEAGKRKNGGSKELVDALESHAHRLWARRQAENQNFAQAIPVYRQNLRITREYVAGGPLRVNMELCAAMWLAGREDDARELASRLDPKLADWAAMPAWAGDALRRSGLLK